MAQFKRFSGSESERFNSSYVGSEGELTWDPDNGLRIHDGYQNGGQQIGIRSYQNLQDLPTNLASIQSGNVTNNRQFLRYNSSTYEMEFANDFRVVPVDDVDFPGGTIDVDKAGDVAFDQDAIYYCYQQPNAYSIAYGGSTGWSPEGWLRINGIGPNNKIPQVGDSLTDGTTTSTIVSVEAPWQDQGGGATFMLINISPAVSSWKNGSGNLTVYTGVAPVSDCWVKFSKSYNDLTNKPTIPADVSDLTDTTNLLSGGSSSSGFETKNANFTAEACKTYWLDSGTSAKTVTLPASPTAGDWVKIYDGSLNWTTYNLTVNGNGNNIRTVDMGAGQVWGTPASTSTLNQAAISPTGPLGATFVWNGTYWHGAA